jgi:hypothetical protein
VCWPCSPTCSGERRPDTRARGAAAARARPSLRVAARVLGGPREPRSRTCPADRGPRGVRPGCRRPRPAGVGGGRAGRIPMAATASSRRAAHRAAASAPTSERRLRAWRTRVEPACRGPARGGATALSARPASPAGSATPVHRCHGARGRQQPVPGHAIAAKRRPGQRPAQILRPTDDTHLERRHVEASDGDCRVLATHCNGGVHPQLRPLGRGDRHSGREKPGQSEDDVREGCSSHFAPPDRFLRRNRPRRRRPSKRSPSGVTSGIAPR